MIKKFVFFIVLSALLVVFLTAYFSISSIALGEENELKRATKAKGENSIEVKFREPFTVWIHDTQGEKITQFSITFEQVLFEGEESFGRLEQPPPGKKYVKIPYNFKNLGPREWIGRPGISAELKVAKGYIYPEKIIYWEKIKRYAEPREVGNGHLIFLIPVDATPVEAIGTIGNSPNPLLDPFEIQLINFHLILSKGIPSFPPEMKGYYSPSRSAREQIKLIKHYLVPGTNPQLHIEYKNIGNRTLKVLIGMFWMDENLKDWGQLSQRGPISPGEEEELVYNFKVALSPKKIASYTLNMAVATWPNEPWPPSPFWNPGSWPIVKPVEKIKAPIVTTEPALIKKTNLSEEELYTLGAGIERVLEEERTQKEVRALMRTRASVLAIDLITTSEVFKGLGGVMGKFLAHLDQTLGNLENILQKELPDLKFDIRPPKEIIELKSEDKQVISSLTDLAALLCDLKIPFLGKLTSFSVEWLSRKLAEALIMKELGYAEVSHPPIGTMTLIYNKKDNVAWVNISLDDLPTRTGYKWNKEQLYMFIPFDPKPPQLKKIKGEFAYKVFPKGESTNTDIREKEIINGFFKGTYDSLATLEESVNDSWAQVNNQYQRRADLIPNLVETVKGYASHEKETFIAVTEARAKVGQLNVTPEILNDPQAFSRFQLVQGEISSALSRLMAVSERYPELKANENFLALQSQLEGTENRIAVERKRFNKKVQIFNTKIDNFPKFLISRMYIFKKKMYFKSEPAAEKVPEVKF